MSSPHKSRASLGRHADSAQLVRQWALVRLLATSGRSFSIRELSQQLRVSKSTVERDLAADYRKAFPEVKQPVPPLTGILLKCDSNNTGTAGRSVVACVELVRPRGK